MQQKKVKLGRNACMDRGSQGHRTRMAAAGQVAGLNTCGEAAQMPTGCIQC